MKHFVAAVFLCPLFLLTACELSPIRDSYLPVLPELPAHWEDILGAPYWRLEWLDKDGASQNREIAPDENTGWISPVEEWSNPVLVWPFWPERNLLPGMMRPAGAMFPWDVKDKIILLSWKGGVEAFLWKEMAAAERNGTTAKNRLPWRFDWPRFRELLESESLSEVVRRDFWLAGWKDIAPAIVRSGFDSRRVKPQKTSETVIPGLNGIWINSSPFAPPLDAGAEGPLRVQSAGVPGTWVSRGGILKCSSSGWVFHPNR